MKVVQSTRLGELACGEANELLHDEQRTASLLFTGPPYRENAGPLTPDGYVGWLDRMITTLANRRVKPGGSVVVVLGSDWGPLSRLQRVFPLMAMSKINLPLLQMFAVAHEQPITSPSVRGFLDPLMTSGERALDVVEYAFWFGVPGDHLQFADWGGMSNLILANHSWRDVGGRSMPVSVPRDFIRALTKPGELVLDPFAGTNSTGVAAEITNRRWLSVEKNAAVCADAAQRLTNAAQ